MGLEERRNIAVVSGEDWCEEPSLGKIWPLRMLLPVGSHLEAISEVDVEHEERGGQEKNVSTELAGLVRKLTGSAVTTPSGLSGPSKLGL